MGGIIVKMETTSFALIEILIGYNWHYGIILESLSKGLKSLDEEDFYSRH